MDESIKIPNKFYLFFVLAFIFNLCLSIDCPRDKPILKNNTCVSEYCPYGDFEDKICVVANPFIKTQWLNNIHVFSLDPISDVCTATNWKGDLFLMGQGYSEENERTKYLYAFYKDGNGLFYDDEYESYYSFETIKMPENKIPETFYSVHIDNKEYLLSSQVENQMFLIDMYNKNYTIYTLDTFNHYSGDLLRLKGYYDDEEIEDEDERVYFTDYTYCLDRGTFNDCFLGLRIFRFDLKDISIEKEVNIEIQINPLSRETCFQNADLYIQCVYTSYLKDESKYNRVVSLFDYKTLELVHSEILEEDIDSQIAFDSTLQMKGNFFVTGYSYPNDLNVFKLLLKKFVVDKSGDEPKFTLENYLPNIEAIHVNEDGYFSIEKGVSIRNFMVKISETKFAVLINEYTDTRMDTSWNKKLLILICTIFNESRLSIRYYRINFELYDLRIYEDVRGYTLNNFFGVLLEGAVGEESFTPRALFLTFGYVNSTYEDAVDKFLKLNDTDSVIILENYITEMENNLFGYKFLGVKILKLPDPNKSGYFVNNKTNATINEGDIVSIDTVLRFILSRKLNIEDEFTIKFAGAVQEPSFDEMNAMAERVDVFPVNNTDSERLFYTPQILIGRVVNFIFEIRCFEACNGCTKLSNDPTEQHCIHCKPGYHFIEGTNNCAQEISCHPNCGTCFAPPDNKNNMNCLTCQEDFHFFEETNSCLNCPKYVSYDLKECIDEIPKGYYLQNSELGTLGKCHELCKACDEGPELWGMHCTECKYSSDKFFPQYEGDCPTENYDEEVEEEEESGECPRDKPILVRYDFCAMVYCSPEEYEDSICVVENSYIKKQWLNNIQRFEEGYVIFPSVTYGFYGELFLFAQQRDIFDNTFENYIYAVDLIGQPLFYDDRKQESFFLRTTKFPDDIYLESVRYILNFENNNTFLLSTQIEDKMYAINYLTGEINTFTFEKHSYSSDDIFIFKDKEEYFTNFIHCQNNYNLSNCYMVLRKFNFNADNEINVINERLIENERINSETNFICMPGFQNFIQCIYTSVQQGFNMHKLGLFDYDSLELKYTIDLMPSFETEAFFDSMIMLNEEAFVMGFSVERNVIKILMKTMNYDISEGAPFLEDYVSSVPEILLNDEDYFDFDNGIADRNSLCRLNDDKFAILVNSYNGMPNDISENSELIIYIVNIYNERKNIIIRGYSINLRLYNMVNYGKIYGYALGNFFGILVESSAEDNLRSVSTSFITFGYINTTQGSSIFDSDFITGNSEYSKSIKFANYIGNIENNLFGYEFAGVYILELPHPSVGTFIDDENEDVFMSDTYKLENEIRLKVNTKRTYDSGTYSVVFAGAATEGEYDDRDLFASAIFYYPEEDFETDDREFYKPEVMVGRPFEYKFELTGGIGKPEEEEEEEEEKEKEKEKEEEPTGEGCYPSCATCYKYSKDHDNHQCKVCKPDYYFKEDTYNCYQEISEYYYFDEEAEIFSPCYPDCVTCRGKANSPTEMNCLSCEDDYNFYDKSKNCLKCSNYVNYEQTECIDQIPDGYYLRDEMLGTIEKCYPLCKTCSEGESYDEEDNHLMNCDTCKYEVKGFVPKYDGECPDPNGEIPKPEEDEYPVDGQCSKERPILKDNKCQNIYCTDREFQSGTCQKYNNYVKTQWFNNFHIFDEDLSSYVNVDTNEYGEVFLMAQREDTKTFKKYIYGFDSRGRGILYDKKKDKDVAFKTFSSKFQGYTIKTKYVEIGEERFILNMLKDNVIYLINLDKDEVISHYFNYTAFSSNAIINLDERTNSYLLDFIYCVDKEFEDCYLGLASYSLISKDSFFLEETNSDDDPIQVDYDTKLTCFKNDEEYIQCTYSLNEDLDEFNEYILGIFDPDDLALFQDFTLDEKIMLNPPFDSMMQLTDNAFVIAYSIDPNVIEVMFFTLDYKEDDEYTLSNYLEGITEIDINENKLYKFEGGSCFKNSLLRLNDEEFVMMVNEYTGVTSNQNNLNTAMVIFFFKIYNNNRNVLVRHYKIDFKLYNMFIDGELVGYKLGDYFGLLAEVTSPKEKYLSRASFLTFGYINTTDDVEAEEGTKNIITSNKKIKVSNYIKNIENNLFGYTLEGVKILSLPNENKAGYLVISNNNNKRVKVNDTISLNSELSFVKANNPVDGEYSFSFAGVAKEPKFKEQNNYANKVVNYPNDVISESYFTEQKTFVGREFKYSFIIGNKPDPKEDDKPKQKCYKNCETCEIYSEEDDDQNCLTCKSGYYFKEETKNCYSEQPSKSYFDKEEEMWMSCHRNCLTCSGKENGDKMNCLTCESGFNFYQKSNNCLKCPTYVNFNQTECLQVLPKGYYIEDKNLGIIGKCHDLCQTCDKGSTIVGGVLNMNCKTCLYENSKVKLKEGDCPAVPGKGTDYNKTEEEEKETVKTQKSVILVFTIIICSVLAVLIIGVIIFLTCYNRSFQDGKANNTDYYNIGGKNIPFEEENNDNNNNNNNFAIN